jgi:hypothetical protein
MSVFQLGTSNDYSRFKLLFLLCIALAQLADVISTNVALRVPGAFEANPVVLLSHTMLGNFWWLPKLVLLLGIAVTLRFIERLDRWCALAFVGANAYYLMVITENFWVALRAA